MYAKIITDKHEDVMVKLGAIFAQGIIDAGGRNVTVCLQSRTGHTNMMAVVGMLIFTQYWYWFPLAHFLSLAFSPSCVIGLNENLDMPVMGVKSNAKPSTYGYPAPLEEEKKEEKKVEEPTFEILQNPCRVVRPQLNVISMEEPKKFKAIKDSSIGGIIMVKRVDGETGGDIVEPVTIKK